MRASLPHADERHPDAFDLAFVAIVAVIAAVSSVVMFLIWVGYLRILPLAILSALASAAALVWTWRSWRADAVGVRWPSRRSTVAACLLTVLAVVLFFRPAEYVFDGADASVYIAIAGVLETHGTLTPDDRLAASLSPQDRAALFPVSTRSGSPSRFPGGVDLQPGGTRLGPQFFPLFPAWLASASLAFGSWARWYVNPVLALLGVIALWLLGRRVSGSFAGECAAGLMLINVAQIWFARVPVSEITAQFLILSGLYLTALAVETRRTVVAASAGAAFGLLAVARVDMLILVTPAIGALIALAIRVDGLTRHMAWMAALFAALTLSGVAFALTSARPYTLGVVSTVLEFLAQHQGTWILAGAALAIGIVILSNIQRARSWSPMAVAVIVTAGLLLLSVLFWKDMARGYFLRLIPAAGVVLGLAGLVALLLAPGGRRAVPLVLVLLAGMAYMRSPFDDRVLPGVFRRYLPILLPIVLLGVGHAVHVARARWRVGGMLLLAPAILGAGFAWQSWPIIVEPVMRAGTEELARISSATEPSSLIVWDAGTPDHLALAAQYSLGRESILVSDTEAAGTSMRKVVDAALAADRPVHFAIDPGHGAMRTQSWGGRFRDLAMTPGRSVDTRVQQLVEAAGPFPFRVHHSERRLDFYALGPIASGSMSGVPWRIDVGERDVPYLVDGFYPVEWHGNVSVRWTGATARMRVPPLSMPARQRARLSLRAATHRPAGGALTLNLEWNGRPIGRLQVTAGFTEYDVHFDLADPERHGELTLRCDTFVPRDVGVGTDPRPLGVLVDWVAIDADPIPVTHATIRSRSAR